MSSEEIDALFAGTLAGEYDDAEPWGAVRELRRIGTREVFNRAVQFCKSSDPLWRARGLDVLAQLGRTAEHPANSFSEESFSIISGLLQHEKELLPLRSAIAALGFLDNPLAVPLIAQYGTHPDASVRFQVACALGSYPNHPESANKLLVLMEDADEDVLDWATFGLGVRGDLDSAEIRDALLRRLGDSNVDAREEAMAALGKRRDRRVLSALLTALEHRPVAPRAIEAACQMIGRDLQDDDWEAGDYIAALRQRFSF
jgi:HEAT repeat protein